jgi:hypothetical protein
MLLKPWFVSVREARNCRADSGRAARKSRAFRPWYQEPLERRELLATFSGTVAGTANIFGAGLTVPPAPGGGGPGTTPFEIRFQPGDHQDLTFQSVTGQVSCCGNGAAAFNGPDGGKNASGDTDITSYGGISGIVDPDRTMFFVGVFLTDSPAADPAPDRLTFSDAQDFAELSPQIAQTFFIGDGLSTNGTPHVFHVPAGATRLFLGFADALQFGNPTSPPGWYFDNNGALNVQGSIVTVSQATQPTGPPVLEADRNTLMYGTKAIRLLGYSDPGILDEQAFDYKSFFDRVTSDNNHINFVRVWVNYHWDHDLSPFTQVFDKKRKRWIYDLTNFKTQTSDSNPFFSHLDAFVTAAEAKGVIVQVTFFNGSEVKSKDKPNAWAKSPYNPVNNNLPFIKQELHTIRGYKEPQRGQVYTMETVWRAVDQPLIDRVVDTLYKHGNVMYEAMNEPPGHGVDATGHAFDKRVVDELYSDLNLLPEHMGIGSKVITVNVGVDDGTEDLTQSDLYNWSLQLGKYATKDTWDGGNEVNAISVHLKDDSGTYVDASRYLDANKPVIFSNDGDPSGQRPDQASKVVSHPLENGQDRLNRVSNFLSAVFPTNQDKAGGHLHLDFLDKGLNDVVKIKGNNGKTIVNNTWTTTSYDYNPRNTRVNDEIVKAISAHVVPAGM